MKPYLADPDVTLYQGDALDVLRGLPDESVDCVATSPPWDQQPGEMEPCACGCGELVRNPDTRGRPRKFRRGHSLRVDASAQAEAARRTWTGRKHTDEAKAKLSRSASRPKPWLRGKRNGMADRTGERNPNWKGGVSPERQRLYANAEYRALLTSVRKRDGLKCRECGKRGNLHVHHVKAWADYPELRFDPDNLITLCKSCHAAAHRKEVTP